MLDTCYKIAREVEGNKKTMKRIDNIIKQSRLRRRTDTVSVMCIFHVNSEIISVSVSEVNKCQFQHKDRSTRMNTPTNQHQYMGTFEYRGSQISNLTKINNSIKSYSHAAKLDLQKMKPSSSTQ